VGSGPVIEFHTPQKDDTDDHPHVDVKLIRKPTPHPRDLKDAKTRYVKSKHRVRNMNAELFSSMVRMLDYSKELDRVAG
jgi:hypothetical protein